MKIALWCLLVLSLLCSTDGWSLPIFHWDRRTFVSGVIGSSSATCWSLLTPTTASAYVRSNDKFQYQIELPEGAVESGKPLKTHLDEINFKLDNFSVGVSVDPVRIDSLAEFGTPEELAAKVVLAEVNRDGIFEVKLMEEPIGKDFYQLNYLSMGKRGEKRNVSKFYVVNKYLFALTATCKEELYNVSKVDILKVVDSFRVLQ